MAEEINTPELVLEDVIALEPDALSDEHKAFLEENKAALTPEQATKFSITQETKKEEEIEVETRTKIVEKPPVKEGEEPDIDPDDERTIGKIVDQRLKDAGVGGTRDQLEVDSYIRDHPEYSKYRATTLKYMAHPSYANIPAHNIMAIVASKDQQAIGAQKEREAQKKAKDTQGGGGTARTHQGKIDWSTATPEEFEAQKAKVLGRMGA